MSDKDAASPVPRLDLVPKLDRPLQLWNPLDYLRLLYWVFFFPQAVRWYRETFGDPEHREAGGFRAAFRALRTDPVLRVLAMQEAVLAVGVLALVLGAAVMLGLDVSWQVAAFLAVVGLGVLVWRHDFAASTVASAICYALFVVPALTSAVSASRELAGPVGVLAPGALMGILLGTSASIDDSEAGGVLVHGQVVGISFAAALAWGIALNWGQGVGSMACFAGSFMLGSIGASLRPLDWVYSAGLHLLSGGRRVGSRVVWLPLPRLQRRIEQLLVQDWARGLDNVNQLLAYSAQSLPVVHALNAALECMPEEQLLPSVVALSDGPYQKDLLTYCSAPLRNLELQSVLLDGLLLPGVLPPLRRWVESRFPLDPRLDTPARVACTGFIFWQGGHARAATVTFFQVKDLPGGWELHAIACTLDWALQIGEEIDEEGDDEETPEVAGAFRDWLDQTIALEQIPAGFSLMRPRTIETLLRLRMVAGDAYQASHALTPTVRATAIGRAVAALTRLLKDVEQTCPQPEAALVAKAAAEWRELLIELSGQIGEEFLRQPVENPYEGYSGLPVLKTFVGREGVLDRLNQLWTTQPDVPLPPIILYGHRRMGKTSILRRLESHRGPNLLVASVDMQGLLLADHTGQLFLEFATAVHRASLKSGLDPGPGPTLEDYQTPGTALLALKEVLERLDSQMTGRRLLLIVDEYELAEAKLAEGKFDPDFVRYLRAAATLHRWLGLVFAGLQSLEDDLRHYKAVFFGSAEPVKVTFLGERDALRLIHQPSEDFALEYEEDLARELFRLTHGQPYLLQRLCWELVEMWNQRFMEEGEDTPRVLTLDDLQALLTPGFLHRFFEQADFYFSGVWEEGSPNERRLMAALARVDDEAVLDREELLRATGLANAEGDDALESALRHDFVLEVDDGYRLAVPLMRRWLLDVGLGETQSP